VSATNEIYQEEKNTASACGSKSAITFFFSPRGEIYLNKNYQDN
jgi:hypothetical protein